MQMVSDYLSNGLNMLMNDPDFQKDKKKIFLANIFDQLLASYVDNRNPQLRRMEIHVKRLSEAISVIEDVSLQRLVCKKVKERLNTDISLPGESPDNIETATIRDEKPFLKNDNAKRKTKKQRRTSIGDSDSPVMIYSNQNNDEQESRSTPSTSSSG